MIPTTDGLDHAAAGPAVDDHHSGPRAFEIENTSQSISGLSTYNLDIDLENDDFQFARIMLMGARQLFGNANNPRDCAELLATRDSGEAMGHSVIDAEGLYRVYTASYAKVSGDSYLSHKIFDNDTVAANQYICVQDAYITGSTLRIVFYNASATAKTLWVKGKALVW